MLFNSFEFLWLFPIIFCVYYLITCRKIVADKYPTIGNFLLIVISYGLYMKWKPVYAPLAVIVIISAFILFKNLDVKQSNLINVIGGSTFAVLLIHANSGNMRQWLWIDVFDNVGQYATDTIYIHAIIVPLFVFAICSIIEIIRMKTIEKPLIDITYNFIRKYYPNAK